MTPPPTFGDHARLWYQHQGIIMDRLPADLSRRLYAIWVNYAFAGIGAGIPNAE